MATIRSTATSTLNVQPRIGGDLALLRGVAKALLEAAEDDPDALDHAFLDGHTQGFEEYRACAPQPPGASWSGARACLSRRCATSSRLYRESQRTIISWCLGITQQEHGVDTIREIVNLLALRGNIGRDGRRSVAGPRAQQRPGQPHVRHRPSADASRSWLAWTPSAASTRRASTDSTRSRRSRRCTEAT